MGEGEPRKETIGRVQLFYLWYPATEHSFSGYGITLEQNGREKLDGLLMVDRPFLADEAWLLSFSETVSECLLIPITETGDRGLACQMEIEPASIQYFRIKRR